MVSVLKMISFLFFIMAISVTNCQNDELEIDIRFGGNLGLRTSTDTPMCKYTKETITEEVSKEISVEVLMKIKDSVNETGDDIQEPGTCVIRGPDGKKYNITSGASYGNGRIKYLSDVPGKVVPPNYCGVYFDGFYPEEFGEWEFTMPTSIEKITTNAVIETVEGPCHAIMPGSSKEPWDGTESGEVSIDGQWSEWGSWSHCSESCGGGNMKSSRSCDSPPPSGGGATCPGTSNQVKECNTQPCIQWGSWSSWSTSCTKTRSRECDGGETCPGDSSQSEGCNSHPSLNTPVVGGWGSWSPWSSCGQGRMTRTRECDGGDTCPGDSSQSEGCNNPHSSNTTEALIISGDFRNVGKSVEVFVPSTGQHCQLPKIPGRSRDHTMEGMTVCCSDSPSNDWKSCLTLTDSGWETSATLLENRAGHSSWSSPSGLTILMGGHYSSRTTEKIQEDGTSVKSFDLEYDTDEACAINLGATVLITGGRKSLITVSEYSEDGYLRDLPQLLEGRSKHGCTYYVNDKGTKTYLVTGGYTPPGYTLSSTELLEETATSWVKAGELPTPRDSLRVARVDNRVLSTGGFYHRNGNVTSLDEILEFDPSNGWTVLAKMTKARFLHAVSTIPFTDVEKFCN